MRKWGATIFASALGLGLGAYGIAAANGHAWEMLWLPAVVVWASWPYEPRGRLRSCLRNFDSNARKRPQ
jgi:hypothetical protein